MSSSNSATTHNHIYLKIECSVFQGTEGLSLNINLFLLHTTGS